MTGQSAPGGTSLRWLGARRRAPALPLAWALVAFAATPGVCAQAPASPPDTLRLAEAIAIARAANPMLRADRLRAMAASERVAPAGAWNDPELTLGLINRPLGGSGMTEPMTMNTVRLAQMVPWPGTRSRARSAADALADADSLDVLDAEAMLEARVAAGYHRLAAIDATLGVMEETLRLLDGLRAMAMARYGAGEAPQQDVLQAQVNAARMEADLVAMRGERLAEAARFNALLAREPWAPIGALPVAEHLPVLPPVDSLAMLAESRRPALAAAAARTRAAGHEVARTRREAYPDLMVAAEYGQRSRFDDMATLMVGVRVPVFARSRQRPMQREREAMHAMAEAMAVQLHSETWALLAEGHAMADRAARLTALYDTRILPQVRAAAEAAQSAYRAGTADVMTLLESQMTHNRVRIERIRLVAEFHSAWAEIRALLGSAGEGRP